MHVILHLVCVLSALLVRKITLHVQPHIEDVKIAASYFYSFSIITAIHVLQASQFRRGLQEVSSLKRGWETQAPSCELIAMHPMLPEDISEKLAGELDPLSIAAWRDATRTYGFSETEQKQVSMLLLLLLLLLPKATVHLWCSKLTEGHSQAKCCLSTATCCHHHACGLHVLSDTCDISPGRT